MIAWLLVACHVVSSADSSAIDTALPCQAGSIADFCASGCPSADELAARCAASGADSGGGGRTWTCQPCGDLIEYRQQEYLWFNLLYVQDGELIAVHTFTDSPEYCGGATMDEWYGPVEPQCP
jgi:hypothetical protein